LPRLGRSVIKCNMMMEWTLKFYLSKREKLRRRNNRHGKLTRPTCARKREHAPLLRPARFRYTRSDVTTHTKQPKVSRTRRQIIEARSGVSYSMNLANINKRRMNDTRFVSKYKTSPGLSLMSKDCFCWEATVNLSKPRQQ
jgi:hypothetical protein